MSLIAALLVLKVLIIGDSISIGYTPFVNDALKERAQVVHNEGNAAHTRHGLLNLEKWLGSEKWDVIHFNFGLHDLKIMDTGSHQVPVEEYESNLRQIVGRLRKTGAKLIWATTTPVPAGNVSPLRRPADVALYNAAAARVMQAEKIPVNDLHAAAAANAAQWQRPVNVHYHSVGSQGLARLVVQAITSK